jgi:recombination protein RecT
MTSETGLQKTGLTFVGTRMMEPSRWAELLPAHISPDKFQRWALTVVQRPELAAAIKSPEGQLSIITALMDCATLGLEPGRTYHLVPFKGKITGIIDYKGEIELIIRKNPNACVIAQLVRKADTFTITGANVPPCHDADWFGDSRGEVIGGYAYVDYGRERYSLVVRMSEADFLNHRAKAQTTNVWDTWPESMRLKTLVHQLRKWVPWSTELT